MELEREKMEEERTVMSEELGALEVVVFVAVARFRFKVRERRVR